MLLRGALLACWALRLPQRWSFWLFGAAVAWSDGWLWITERSARGERIFQRWNKEEP